MAVWQFDLHMIPRDAVIRMFSQVPTHLEMKRPQDVDWWIGSEIPIGDLRRRFSTLLPQAESWADNIEIWGKDDSDRIDLVAENETVAGVFVRVDLRQPLRTFPAGLVAVARELGCVLLTEQCEILEPEEGALIDAIRKSPAARFVSNPQKFFHDMTKVQE